MRTYTIQNFWRERLAIHTATAGPLVRGWSFEREGFATFKEAPLTLCPELTSDADPERVPVLLVSAPGAVGKSTLARQIAFTTGSAYVDLANAEPVGGNSISGGLVRSGLYANWESQDVALLIDGLDEARLRVTREAFEAFLAEVADLAKDRTKPTVLFGRTGAVEDAWLLLSGGPAPVAVLEIGYYDPEASVEFVVGAVRALRPGGSHPGTERKAIELLLDRIRKQTESDGDRFAGYAPVLLAVAQRVAREDNPAALVAQVEKGAQAVTLQDVVSAIMQRERGKLDTLAFEDATLADQLYLPDEQLDRLVARVYGLQQPDPRPMGPVDAHTYSTALDTWVADHPFLKGGNTASSAVFEAVIIVRALKNPVSRDVATLRELRRGVAANPFVSDFYLPEGTAADQHVPPEHVGVLYASLRARLSLGDTASLLVEGPEEGEEEELLRASVEITVSRRDGGRPPRALQFDTDQTGILKLGAYVEDVELTVPYSHVDIGPGPEAVLIAPVSIQCQRLAITADKIIGECPQGLKDAAIYIESVDFCGAQITSVPVLRGKVSLAVAWPGALTYPWTSFAAEPPPPQDPRIDEALRRFRKFIIAFRSHSKGNLGRYRHKIEHSRMTKGSGQAVLNLLVSEQILSLHGTQYYLDPAKLGAQTGATYTDTMSRRFGPKAVAFVKRAIEASEK